MSQRIMTVEKIGKGESYKVTAFSCNDIGATKAGWFKRFNVGKVIDKLTLRRIIGTRHWQIDFTGNIAVDVPIK